MTTPNVVGDGKLSDENLGRTYRKFGDIIRRTREGTLDLELVNKQLQAIAENRTLPGTDLAGSRVIKIDRSQPMYTWAFSSQYSMCETANIVELDERSAGIETLDIAKIRFLLPCEDDGEMPTFQERLTKLKMEHPSFIRLDAHVAMALWDERDQVSLQLLRILKGIHRIDFLGTVVEPECRVSLSSRAVDQWRTFKTDPSILTLSYYPERHRKDWKLESSNLTEKSRGPLLSATLEST